MSRAISLYTDRVTHSLRSLQESEEEEARDPIRQDDTEASKSPSHEDTHDAPSNDPEGGHHIDCGSVALARMCATTYLNPLCSTVQKRKYGSNSRCFAHTGGVLLHAQIDTL